MAQQFNGKLECLECHTIYLSIPVDVSSESPIHCSTCNAYIARWHEIEENFADQGGMDGAFRMDHGKILRVDRDPVHARELSADLGDLNKAISEHDFGK